MHRFTIFQKEKSVFQTGVWDDYFNKLVLHDTLNTGWFNYTKEMAAAIANKSGNIYQLTYEDLLLNIQEQIELLVEFLGLPCDENFVKQVVKKCKFHNLKDNKVDTTGAFYPEYHIIVIYVLLTCYLVKRLIADGLEIEVLRKGVIGGWKNWFTVAQNEQFEEICKRVIS